MTDSIQIPQDELKRIALAKGLPTRLTLEVTTACQLTCQHCYNFDRQSGSPTTSMSYETIEKLLAEAEALGVLELELTGGEATLHPQILDIISEAKRRHFWVVMKSHGVLSPRRTESIVRAGLDKLVVSIYGNRKVHDGFTGVRGSWEKSRAVLSQVAAMNMCRLEVSIIMHSQNYKEIKVLQAEYVELCDTVKVGKILHPRHVGGDVPESIRLSQAQWLEFYKSHYEGKPPRRAKLDQYGNRNFKCGCATESFAIAANGDVYPCIGVPWRSGSIHENSLREIWEGSEVFQKVRNLKNSDYKHCQDCTLKQYCERIAPSAYMASQDYLGFQPAQCDQAQAHADYAKDR